VNAGWPKERLQNREKQYADHRVDSADQGIASGETAVRRKKNGYPVAKAHDGFLGI
jgi:hypothetical protein